MQLQTYLHSAHWSQNSFCCTTSVCKVMPKVLVNKAFPRLDIVHSKTNVILQMCVAWMGPSSCASAPKGSKRSCSQKMDPDGIEHTLTYIRPRTNKQINHWQVASKKPRLLIIFFNCFIKNPGQPE